MGNLLRLKKLRLVHTRTVSLGTGYAALGH